MKKLKIAALLALPVALGLYLNSAMSWRPRTLATYKSPVLSVAWAPDGKRLASVGDGYVTLWDAGRMRVAETLKSPPSKRANQVAFSPDGKLVAASYTDLDFMEGQVRLWDAATGKPNRTWRVDRTTTGLAFSGDGKTLAASGYMGVGLWNVPGAKPAGKVDVGDTFLVRGVALSLDGQTVVGLGEGRAIHTWNVRKAADDSYYGESPGKDGDCVAFSPDGRILTVGSHGGVHFFNARTDRPMSGLVLPNVRVSAVAFSSDSSTLAVGSDKGRIELWNVSSRKPGRTLRGHDKAITSLAFAPDSSTLASSSADGTVRLWRLR